MEEIPLSVWVLILFYAIPLTVAFYYYAKRKINDSSKRHKSKVSSSDKT